jgi:hypothetical protein
MIVEGTILGIVMAGMWRGWHSNQKAMYDKYYANLRASMAASDEE